MRNPWKEVKGGVQPPLFELAASATTLQACYDRTNETIVFGVQTLDPIDDHLIALWCSPPVSADRYLKMLSTAHKEFLRQLWENTGPFA